MDNLGPFESLRISGERDVDALVRIFEREKSPNQRATIAQMLGWWADARAVPALVAALGERDVSLRMIAAESLGWVGSGHSPLDDEEPDWQDEIMSSRFDRQPRVAADTEDLGQIVDALLRAAKDPDRSVASAAISALGVIKDPRAIDPLVALYANPDKAARDAIAAALRQIRGESE